MSSSSSSCSEIDITIVLDRDDLVDDVADFLARGFGVELGELGEVDGLDQGAEDRALGLVVGLGMARVGRGRRERRRRLVRHAAMRLPGVGAATSGAPRPDRGDRRAAALDDAGRRWRRARRRLRRGRRRRLQAALAARRGAARRRGDRGCRTVLRFPNTELTPDARFSA